MKKDTMAMMISLIGALLLACGARQVHAGEKVCEIPCTYESLGCKYFKLEKRLDCGFVPDAGIDKIIGEVKFSNPPPDMEAIVS